MLYFIKLTSLNSTKCESIQIRFTVFGSLKGVEPLVQKGKRIGQFLRQSNAFLEGIDPSFMNSVTGSICRAKCSNILQDNIVRANIHCEGIACTRSLNIDLKSWKVKKDSIYYLYEYYKNLINPLFSKVMPVFYLMQALSMFML